MSETPRRDEAQGPAEQTSTQADREIADLPEQVELDKADRVLGGLNPQPLPPGIRESLNPQPLPPGIYQKV